MDSLGESWVVQLLNANSIVGGELESFEDHLLLYSFTGCPLVVTLYAQRDLFTIYVTTEIGNTSESRIKLLKSFYIDMAQVELGHNFTFT